MGAAGWGDMMTRQERIDRLREKLAGLEAKRDKMKAVNAAFRQAKGDPAKMAAALGWKVESAEWEIATVASGYDRQPHPFWELADLGAQIRTVKARLAEVEEVAAIESGPIVDGAAGGLTFAFTVEAEDERVWCTWSGRPSREICKEMRSGGFVFSRSRGAWVRKLTPAAIHASRYVAERLGRLS